MLQVYQAYYNSHQIFSHQFESQAKFGQTNLYEVIEFTKEEQMSEQFLVLYHKH